MLRQTLLLLHPVIPFITEELWALLGYGAPGTFLMRDARIEDAPHGRLSIDQRQASTVASVKMFVSQARALKAEHNLASRRDVRFLVKTGDVAWAVLEGNLAKLMRMSGATEFVRQEVVEGAPAVVTTLGTLYLDLASTVDAAAEKVRLTKELEAMAKHIAGTEARLGNEAFISKAPPAVLEGARKQLADQKAKQAELIRLRAALG